MKNPGEAGAGKKSNQPFAQLLHGSVLPADSASCKVPCKMCFERDKEGHCSEK